MKKGMRRILRRLCMILGLSALCAAAAFAAPGTARAQALTVTNCTDTGVAGDGSLRGEIVVANTDNANDAITFSVDCPSGSPITLNSGNGTLTLTGSMTIDGTGHTIVVDGGCTFGGGTCTSGGVTVFTVFAPTGPQPTVSLTAVTIQHGNGTTGCCGGSGGGGVYNVGTLTVTNSTFDSNAATGNVNTTVARSLMSER